MTARPRADAHIHLFERGFPGDRGHIPDGVDEYDAARRLAGIDAALVVGYEGEAFAEGNNAYVRSLAPLHPWIHSAAYVPAARVPSADDAGRLRDEGHVGIAVYAEETGRLLDRWEGEPGLLDELAGAIVSVNARPGTLAAERRWVEALEGSSVLVSHLGLPGRVAAEDAAEVLAPVVALAELPHVSIKLSGLYAIDPIPPHPGARPAVELLLDAFGPERMLWGSDFSPVLGYTDTAAAMEFPDRWGGLDDAARAALDGGSLLRMLASAWAR